MHSPAWRRLKRPLVPHPPLHAPLLLITRTLVPPCFCTPVQTQVEKEVGILQQLHHPHLVSFMFIADQGSRISIVMDWAGENLREHRTVTQSQQYTEDVARYMMYQLTSALVYLHNKVGRRAAVAGVVLVLVSPGLVPFRHVRLCR